MKTILAIIGVLAILVGGFIYFGNNESVTPAENEDGLTEMVNDNEDNDQMGEGERQVVMPGEYQVNTDSSLVNWSGKKPLIDGYVNSGTLEISEGSILVGDGEASGSFVIDMNTLKVGLTAKKPNQETALEGHLKGEGWFNVETYPTASFVITSVEAHADSDTTFEYDIVGDLTMKGETHEVTFPATIYQTADKTVVAVASTTIDRTKWGITAGSGSFFDNLADNVIDDMIALSFKLVAN
ncbi:YceI family protein [Candidatus Kaiserbacteria bacterium]|nr:YceI family protein [Candidatus Kaiserbacteria bacterium]